MVTKTIKGQAFISGKSLVQDIILLVDDKTSNNTIVIIEDIWEDLLSPSGEHENNGKGYWYWEVEMSDTEDTDKLVKVKISCPSPDASLFDYDFTPSESDSDWAKFWKAKMKKTQDSVYNSTNGLQQKEVTMPGTKYISPDGSFVEVEEIKYTRNDLGDIQNLLFNLF